MNLQANQRTDRSSSHLCRRRFLQGSLAGVASSSLVVVGQQAVAAGTSLLPASADSCIFIWLGGGACHIDTWDPKRKSESRKTPGSYYEGIGTAINGVQVCQHLPKVAPLLDRCVLVRSVHHNVIDEHAAATNRLHTGRPTTGTTIYPSIGSVVSHELGPRGEKVPAYVVMGYPSASRGPGFLGAKYSYLYLTETRLGPPGLRRPVGVSAARQKRREDLLDGVRRKYLQRQGNDKKIRDYAEAAKQGFRIAGPDFMSVFDLSSESEERRELYGGEFGQRCLLARRLVESGVRFVEVSFNLNFINGTGWDTHNEGQKNQHLLIKDLDQALAALISDLERRGRLAKTLIVVATEFGRPPEFDGGGGRGHHSKAFSVVLAGGGLKTGQVVGATDELGREIVDRPVSVPDLHATIYASLGVDHAKELYDLDRPVPITDRGTPIREVLA